MKKTNTVFMFISGGLVLQHFITAIGGVIMAPEYEIAILILGLIPAIVWAGVVILSKRKEGVASFTLPIYVGLTLLFGVHFYLLTTKQSYGLIPIIELFVG